MLLAKAEHPAYQKLVNSQLDKLKSGRQLFEQLSVVQQATVMKAILELFLCTSTESDLTLIKGSKHTINNRFSKNITKLDSFVIIHQSVTGLYEQRIDLMQL